jgi:hypothetical protein
MWNPALVFTSVLILFLIVAFFRTPPQGLTRDQRTILLLLFALLAGFSTYFLGGAALLELTGDIYRGVKLGFSATAGIAVFVFCYLYPPYFFRSQPDEKPKRSGTTEGMSAEAPAQAAREEQRADEPPVQKGAGSTGTEPDSPHQTNVLIPDTKPAVESVREDTRPKTVTGRQTGCDVDSAKPPVSLLTRDIAKLIEDARSGLAATSGGADLRPDDIGAPVIIGCSKERFTLRTSGE